MSDLTIAEIARVASGQPTTQGNPPGPTANDGETTVSDELKPISFFAKAYGYASVTIRRWVHFGYLGIRLEATMTPGRTYVSERNFKKFLQAVKDKRINSGYKTGVETDEPGRPSGTPRTQESKQPMPTKKQMKEMRAKARAHVAGKRNGKKVA